MKIESGTAHIPAQQEALLKRSVTQPTAEAQHQTPSNGAAFNVDISPVASQTAHTQDSDEISRDRVAAIRDQLAAGTYNISGKDVAKKILGVLK
jgi:flagellar biosynthesis anti-sigma factor FlgM